MRLSLCQQEKKVSGNKSTSIANESQVYSTVH